MLLCGIPSVTLLGEKDDYEQILMRLEKLCEYGSEPTTFCNMLKDQTGIGLDTLQPRQGWFMYIPKLKERTIQSS